MTEHESVQQQLRRSAADIAATLSPEQRENLLIGGWMSHDARWFNAVAGEFGLAAANRLNRQAAFELGRVEARRVAAAAGLQDVTSRDGYLVAQELIITLLGPNLLTYDLVLASADSYQIRVERCFAFENVSRAGIAAQYECGVFARVAGWQDGLGVRHDLQPSPGACLRAQGRPCAYTVTIQDDSAGLTG